MKIGRLEITKRTDEEIRDFIAETRSGPDGAPKFGEKTLKALDRKAARKAAKTR